MYFGAKPQWLPLTAGCVKLQLPSSQWQSRASQWRAHAHRGNTASAQLPSVTVVWSGNHHLVCPNPAVAEVLPAGCWVGAYHYAHIDIFHKKGYWFKIRTEFLRPILAKIELICQQPAMTQWGGVQGGKPASSGVLERMAERSRSVLDMPAAVLAPVSI